MRLSRIRFVNIKLDDGLKIIPDVTWHVNGKNGVFLLENGGGKTSFIQLALQTILPNAPMGKRMLKDTVEKKSVGHVLTEWIIDTVEGPARYLMLGFTFHNQQKEQADENKKEIDALTYYNYIYEYEEDDDYRLEHFPVAKNHRPAGYQELRKFIRKHGNIYLYDRKASYQEALRRYKILPEEWEQIRKTNEEEGGVGAFFANAKTTEALLKKILLPTAETIIFESETKKDELKKVFLEHKKRLVRLPEYKKDIKEVEQIKEDAEAVVKASEYAKEKHTAWIESIKKAHHLQTQLSHEQWLLEEQKRNLEEIHEQKQKEQNDWDYRVISYEHHELVIKQHDLEQQVEKLTNEIETITARYSKTKQTHQELEALRLYRKLNTVRVKLQKVTEEIESQKRNHKDKLLALEEAKAELETLWNQVLLAEEQHISELEKEKQHFAAKIEKEKLEKDKLQQELQHNYEQRIILNNTLERYNIKYNELQTVGYTDAQLLQPKEAIDSYESQKIDITEQIRNIRESLLTVREKAEHLKFDLVEWDKQRDDLQRQIEKQKADINTYNLDFEQVEKWMFRLGRSQGRWFENADQHFSFFDREIAQRMHTYSETSYLLQSVKKELLRYDKEYFVPHETLQEIKDYLTAQGFFVLLGGEWLSAQPISETEKESYLTAYPLLPYSLVTEEKEKAGIIRNMSQYQEASLEIPIIFQDKRMLTTVRPSPAEEELFVYSTTPTSWFSSAEYREEKKAQCVARIKELEEILSHNEREKKDLQDARKAFESFIQTYEENSASEFNEELNRLHQRMEEMSALKEDIHHKLKELEEEEAQVSNQREQEEEKLKSVEASIQQLTYFNNEFSGIRNIKESLANVEMSTGLLETQRDNCEYALENLKQKQTQHSLIIHDTRKDFAGHKEFGKKHDLHVLPVSPSSLTFQQVLEQEQVYLARKNVLNSELFGLHSQEELQSSLQEQQNTLQEQIAEKNITDEWLRDHDRFVDEKEIEDIKEKLNKQRTAKEQLTADKQIAEIQKSRLSGSIDTKKKELMKRYLREPFEYDNNEDTATKQRDSYKVFLKETTDKLGEISDKKKEVELTYQIVVGAYSQVVSHYVIKKQPYIKGEPENSIVYGKRAEEDTSMCLSKVNVAVHSFEQSKLELTRTFNTYITAIEQTKNYKLTEQLRTFKRYVEQEQLLDSVDEIIEGFVDMFDALNALVASLKEEERQLQEDKQALCHMVMQRITRIYEHVMEMPNHSKISLYDLNDFPIIKMKWNHFSEEMTVSKIEEYIEQLLANVSKMQQQGEEEDHIEDYVLQELETVKLMNCYAPVHKCDVKIFKPRKEEMMRQRIEYKPWEEAANWSGGEGYVSYMAMFMILITHIRKKRYIQGNSWQTIIADNPFGKASSEHILQPMIELAKRNSIQLFCLTALKQESIRQHFEVVFSNRYTAPRNGHEILTVQQLDKTADPLTIEQLYMKQRAKDTQTTKKNTPTKSKEKSVKTEDESLQMTLI
ncbi:hypothetical protein CN918_30600 [Priestia megaterium]|nr:hypothetical protein CN918_30600 [Priestia megaterium]